MITNQFKEAGLTLRSADRPFGGDQNAHIFGLDIQKDEFLVWLPEHVIVQVQAKDKKMRQVVLVVKEPETTFTVEILPYQKMTGDKVLNEWVHSQNRRLLVERKTPKGTRHFLCGVDERDHPFIAQLQGPATSIRAAHELLKPPEVRGRRIKGHGKNSKVKAKESVPRQGEFFFVHASEEEVLRIEETIRKTGTRKKVPIEQTRGNPHVADERLLIPVWEGKRGRQWPEATYIRGKVRHKEHETLDFPSWMRVIRNLEAGAKGRAVGGGTWID